MLARGGQGLVILQPEKAIHLKEPVATEEAGSI